MHTSNACSALDTVLTSGTRLHSTCREPVRLGYVLIDGWASSFLTCNANGLLFTIQDVQLSERWAEEASIMFERATSGLLKNNMLLQFAHADFEEVFGNILMFITPGWCGGQLILSQLVSLSLWHTRIMWGGGCNFTVSIRACHNCTSIYSQHISFSIDWGYFY